MNTSGIENTSGGGRPTAWKSDILASLVVFMVALPLCIAIARACGMPPEAGIITGIIGGLFVGPLSGSPLQVSGPAAGLIVLVLDFVEDRVALVESGSTTISPAAALGVAVLLGGLLQLVMAAMRCGPWFRAVSPAVVLGMLGGIGVVIVAKQVHEMIDDRPAASVLDNLLSIPQAMQKAVADPDENPPNHTAAFIVGVVALTVLIGWKPLAPKRLQLVPAALIAVVTGTLVAEAFGLNARRIHIESNLWQAVTLVEPDVLWTLVKDKDIWTMAIAIGVIASAESLLCATAVDQLHRGPRTNYNRELMAQGVGNTICGVLGALPLTGVIVRSSANVAAGARSRLSATLHGLWLVLFVSLLPFVLQRIPGACLAAILVFTGVKLVDWRAGIQIWRASRGEAVIGLATLIGVVFTDLLTGVLLGVGLAAAKLAYSASHLTFRTETDEDRQEMRVHLIGSATFLSLPKLANVLNAVPKGWGIQIELDDLLAIDHSCLHLLTEWEKQHQTTGGWMSLDQDGLRARFERPPATRASTMRGRAELANTT
jgi:MFS superfamily sulfate permease-like transporter